MDAVAAGVSDWRTPSACDSSACAAVRIGLTDVAVRNTDRPDVAVVFSHEEWRAFIDAARAGEFDVGD